MRKILVYNLGSEAGFFSEYNNMILGYLYCLKNQIDFKLYSKAASFAIKNGWTDYFLPFCEEVDSMGHRRYNIRQYCTYSIYLSIYLSIYHRFIFKLKSWWFKRCNGFSYYTYELWGMFHNRDFEKDMFMVNHIKMNTQQACGYLIDQTWRYNPQTKESVQAFIDSLDLPAEYVGMHVRMGDKIIEGEIYTIDTYMSKLSSVTDMKDVFVLTDDYSVIVELKKRYSDYCFYTLTHENESGYDNTRFYESSKKIIYDNLCKLFAAMDCLSKSELCIGTYSSNPGMYLGMKMGNRFIGVDYDSWRIW